MLHARNETSGRSRFVISKSVLSASESMSKMRPVLVRFVVSIGCSMALKRASLEWLMTGDGSDGCEDDDNVRAFTESSTVELGLWVLLLVSGVNVDRLGEFQ